MNNKLLSVIIVTKNEAHNIEECLSSVKFADEIIIFDSSSTDDTVNLCSKYTNNVTVTKDWPGDGPQKNRAIDIANGEWILCLDADERVSSQLENEIINTISSTELSGFNIPFTSTYCGKKINFGDWRGEKHLRLFKKSKGRFTTDVVHCHADIKGKIGTLKNRVIHHPFHHLGAMLHKLNDYSSNSAMSKFNSGKKASLFTALTHSIWSFIRGYILKLGFLDGKEGFILAVSNAEGTYYRYLKLMYLNAKNNKVPA